MRFSRTWHHPAQLEFRFEFAPVSLLADEDDDEQDEWAMAAPIRIIGPAAGRPIPVSGVAASVFDLAALGAPSIRLNCSRDDGAKLVARVEVADGVTRYAGAAYPSRWTPEDEERERQRRARQRPPRPTKKARTRSKKLVELVGVDG